MKLTINKKAYLTSGVFGFIGSALMIPGMAVAFIMMIVAFVLMIPGGAIAMIGARRAPHLDER
tara:strand:- start:813 stop:1001 length:189 start_codon:yes stop_codon:yes gene_type:complete